MTIIWSMVPEIWSMTDIIFCHFGLLFAHLPPNNPKNKNFKNWKKWLEILSFYTLYHKCQLYDIWLLRYRAWQTKCFVLLDNTSQFYLLKTLKIRILKKNEKKTWRYHFTHVCHNWQSYDVWFLRYEAWQTEFFVILDCFLPFYPTKTLKNENFEKNE